ncbi:MAG: MoaD/ThiS family protein [Erysipelotrichaceae bacterium]
MIIRVYPGAMVKGDGLNEDGEIELKQDATVAKLIAIVNVPLFLRPLLVVSVNGKTVKKNHVLHDGDTVSFLTPLAGG